MERKLVKETHIRRIEVEKFIVAVQQIVKPLELGKKSQIVIDYDPGQPTVTIKLFNFTENEGG